MKLRLSLSTLFLAIAVLLPTPVATGAVKLYVSNGFGGDAIRQVSSTGVVSPFATIPAGSPNGLAFDTSGNLYVAGENSSLISKITPGGTVSTFATFPSVFSILYGLAFDTSGNLYVADYSTQQISKITPGGVVSTFATLPGHAPIGLAFDTNGNLYTANHGSNTISKITPAGVVSTFATLPGGSGPRGLAFDTSGNLYVAEWFTGKIDKITPGGAVSTFATLPSGSNPMGLAFDEVGNLCVAESSANRISKISPGGTVSTFATVSSPAFIAITIPPGTPDALDANIVGATVTATAVQPDGKTIIAGFFTSVQGVPRSHIARLNADGSLDMGFDPTASNTVNCVAVQSDGKILLGGFFTTLQPNGAASPTPRNRFARVNADGSLDTGFDPNANSTVNCVAVQADGKILLGGAFNTLQPNGAASATTRSRIARVNGDGSLDTGFHPAVGVSVYSVAVQADGKILLGGSFTTFQPDVAGSVTTRNRIARVNADGSLDTGFDPNANGNVRSVAVQADGKILLAGDFTTLQPNGAASATSRGNVARVYADGSVDPDFDPKANYVGGDSPVVTLAVQADGKILLGGGFTTLQPNGAASPTPRNRFARLNADGSLDMGFDPKPGTTVNCVAVQSDGKILLGGLFTTLQPNGAASATGRSYLARLNNNAATQSLIALDATQVQWQRGGSSPQVSQVTFEQSIDGGANWTALGNGVPVGTSPGWQITGLSLPTSGTLRARGRTSGGWCNGSSGLVETVVSYTIAPNIAVEQPLGTGLLDGSSSIAFGALNVGSSGSVKTFTVKNTGSADLTGLAITTDGTNPGDFSVSAPGTTTLAPGNSTTFTVTFTPGASGARTAAIHIASNVTGPKNPFDISLTGTVLSFANDQDGDGMSDASEFQLAALGFDWEVNQSALVTSYYAYANGAGLFTPAQVQALNVDFPLIQKNPTTGVFTLTIGVQKSLDLDLFNPFPMTGPGTSTVINGAGKLEFEFTVPDNAAFFQLRAE